MLSRAPTFSAPWDRRTSSSVHVLCEHDGSPAACEHGHRVQIRRVDHGIFRPAGFPMLSRRRTKPRRCCFVPKLPLLTGWLRTLIEKQRPLRSSSIIAPSILPGPRPCAVDIIRHCARIGSRRQGQISEPSHSGRRGLEFRTSRTHSRDLT
jgi:hypothetical protein